MENSSDHDGVLSHRIEEIESRPLPDRAALFAQLADELLVELERSDSDSAHDSAHDSDVRR